MLLLLMTGVNQEQRERTVSEGHQMDMSSPVSDSRLDFIKQLHLQDQDQDQELHTVDVLVQFYTRTNTSFGPDPYTDQI